MNENSLLKKMKMKPGSRAAVVNAPDGYLETLNPLPAKATISDRLQTELDWIQPFVRTEAELKKALPFETTFIAARERRASHPLEMSKSMMKQVISTTRESSLEMPVTVVDRSLVCDAGESGGS